MIRQPKDHKVPPPPEAHEHPSIRCYKVWGAAGCGREHDHAACRQMAMDYQRERARERNPNRGTAKATRRTTPLSTEELERLRRAVGA